MNGAKTRRYGACSVVLAAGTLAGLAGCDDSTPLSKAIDQATIKLTALTPGGASAASTEYKTRVFNEVANSLKGQTEHGTSSEKALAQVLIAQAQLGLADGPAGAAADIERGSLNVLTQLESALGQWHNHNAVASAASKFDPTPEIAEIEAANQEKDAAIVQERAHKAQVDAQVAELRSQAAALLDQAKERRARQADLTRRVPNETAVRGEQLLRESAAIGREADGLESHAADLEAQAAKIAPQSDEIQLAIDRINSQKALLAHAREEVARRAAWHAAQARAARAEAEKSAADADAQVKALVETREGTDEGGKPAERAAGAYEQAAATAAAASRETNVRGNAKLIEGSARQSLGDVHWSRAHGLARAAETMAAVANAVPPLPNAGQYKDLLGQLQAQLQASLEAATDAYGKAVEAYGQAGAQGDAQERLQRVQQKLAKVVKLTSGGTVDLMAQLEPSAAPDDGAGSDDAAAGDSPAGDAADQSTVRGTLQLLIDRSEAQDIEGVFALFHAPDDATRDALDAMKRMTAPVIRLEAKCREKFGQGLPAAAPGAPGAGVPGLSGMAGGVSVDDFEIDEQEETARVTAPGSPQPLNMVKADDQWWFSMPAQGDPAMAGPMMGAMTQAISDAVDELVAEIDAGDLDSPQAVMDAFRQKIMAAVLKGATPPGGGGG